MSKKETSMKKKRSGNRMVTLIVIFICVALVFAAAWGIVTGFAKLMHYGENTTIREENMQEDLTQTPSQTPETEEEALPPR